MKISDAIKALTEIMANDGDLDLVGFEERPEGYFVALDNQFHVIGIPDQEAPSLDEYELVCAFAPPLIIMGQEIEDSSDDDPTPTTGRKRNSALKVI